MCDCIGNFKCGDCESRCKKERLDVIDDFANLTIQTQSNGITTGRHIMSEIDKNILKDKIKKAKSTDCVIHQYDI